MGKEVIFIHQNDFIEKLAHETTMEVIKEKFKNSYNSEMIKNCYETDWILTLYYQYKKRTLEKLMKDYEIKKVSNGISNLHLVIEKESEDTTCN